MSETKWIPYDEVVHVVEKATLYDFSGKKVWVPKSVQVDIDETEQKVEVPLWFADKEELY